MGSRLFKVSSGRQLRLRSDCDRAQTNFKLCLTQVRESDTIRESNQASVDIRHIMHSTMY